MLELKGENIITHFTVHDVFNKTFSWLQTPTQQCRNKLIDSLIEFGETLHFLLDFQTALLDNPH